MKREEQILLDRLADNAESIISSRRPDTCRLILSAADMVPDSPYPDQAGMFVGVGKALATHYVLALIWAGYRRKEENGYEVYCLPKRNISEDTLATIIAALVKLNEGRAHRNAARLTGGDWKALAGGCSVKAYESLSSPPVQQPQKPIPGEEPRKPEVKIWLEPSGEQTDPAIYVLLKPLILDFAIIEDVQLPWTPSLDRDAYLQDAAQRLRTPISELLSRAGVRVPEEELRRICDRTASEAFVVRGLRMAILTGEITHRHIEHLDFYPAYKDYFWRTPEILAKEKEAEEHFRREHTKRN